MESLKNMHQQILHNVEMVQDRSSKILQEQEKDLLRAFRARLFDVQVKGGHSIITRGITPIKLFEAHVKIGRCRIKVDVVEGRSRKISRSENIQR